MLTPRADARRHHATRRAHAHDVSSGATTDGGTSACSRHEQRRDGNTQRDERVLTGITGGLGAASGAEEDKARKKATDTVDAQYRLIQALRAHDFDASVARASLSSTDQNLITDDFLKSVDDVLDGKAPAGGARTADQLRADKQAALDRAAHSYS